MSPPTPIHFDAPSGALFGWLHAPSGAMRTTGLVLCAPIGFEEVRSHFALRWLAERLAAEGFPTLRFDYHGTGDSSGEPSDPARVATWRRNIAAAVRELEARTGVSQVSLFGLRLGGLLAALEAQSIGATSLVLWDPCATGASYVREMAYVDLFAGRRVPRVGDHEAGGFLLTEETQRDLGTLSVLRLDRKPVTEALVVSTQGSTSPGVAQKLVTLGVTTTLRHFPGGSCIADEPHEVRAPNALIDATVGWLKARHPHMQPSAAAKPVVDDPFMERPIWFGPRERLFGIVTTAGDPNLPGVILLNAGCVHRIGPHRMSVKLARRWAEHGYATLRCDLSGLGDSRAAPGEDENVMFPVSAVDDVRAAMDAMRAAHGTERFVLAGLCSGAAIAFQAARVDPRVVGAIMLNTAEWTFDARAAMTYDAADFAFRRWTRSWRTTKNGPAIVAAKLGAVAKRALRRLAGAEPVDVAADVREVMRRGVELLLIYSDGDVGLDSLELNLGRVRPRVELIGDADHTFLPLAAERTLIELTAKHLRERHGSVHPCLPRSIPSPAPSPTSNTTHRSRDESTRARIS